MNTREGNLLFPIFLKLEEMQLLIVGGGGVGLEKLSAVLKNSPATSITMVATWFGDETRELASVHTNVALIEKAFEPADLDGKDLVIGATGIRELSEQITKEAHKRRILVNIADTPDLCDFYLGSIVSKGDLKIAISTNGKSPTLAKRIREYLEEALPDTTQHLLDNLQNIRMQMKGDFQSKLQALNELTEKIFKK
ncbi:bifunctional precorrin-2 dehydrogenase/sirohydrochlorin ferrochelatase [Cytophagaceae bacterium YF14B1]|uniref:precorrin-2 dehydrogenase n=1 Tax=Xanthocytophaga flava TaxID=3048013 RepID=A0AAE3U702_9BACT|nr:bifunctional precorrin-2 dehydrogenase/sirohydrochlorin ferrochelatase [Xanthocytophaga flavus]MDJ1466508.1 bifunctional precorrin-2 dehydrogenase/sirohydrochlorin ferrochelatase [Xanthocytophaga flavus]MDJ1479164.1 bifunctional precorrin-2 dehydrogenase/sirohydrochlorin ferrochelatase [Xanthocytophaga flavus]